MRQPAQTQTWARRFAAFGTVPSILRLATEISPGTLAVCAAIRLARSFLPLAMLWVARAIIDSLIGLLLARQGYQAHLWKLVGLEFGLSILGDMLTRVSGFAEVLLGERLTETLSTKLVRHAMTLDLATLESPECQDRIERARSQTSGRMNMLRPLFGLTQDALGLVWLSASLVAFSPWLLVILAFAFIPTLLGEAHFTTLAYRKMVARTVERRQLDYLRYLGASVETAKEVKTFGLGPYLTERFRGLSKTLMVELQRLAAAKAVKGTLLNAISTSASYCGYILALERGLSGGITVGMFTFLIRAFARSRNHMERVVASFTDLAEQAVFLKDIFEFFQMQPEVGSNSCAIPAPRRIRTGWEFQNVGFRYPGAKDAALRNVTFRLEPGEKVALIGSNGAGKTTIAKLFARLYDPSEGQILLDGVDLRDYDVEDLRREIGVIFQDYIRYDASVRDNIGYGMVERLKDEARTTHAAEKAGLVQFIERLPGGYEQMLGRRFDGGIQLSGGEWQKMALARAHMRDAQLLILDEPTAALDPVAEHEVYQRFAALTRGRCTLLISHRFSTVRMADRIVVLDGGRIQEEGTHDHLLRARGRYSDLFALQASAYR